MLGEALGGIDCSAFSKRNDNNGEQPRKRINRLLALDESEDGSDEEVGLMRHNTQNERGINKNISMIDFENQIQQPEMKEQSHNNKNDK